MYTIENFFINIEETDDRYNCFNIKIPINIFSRNVVVNYDELEIFISARYSLKEILPILNQYFTCLSDYGEALVKYMEKILENKIPENWFENMEIYSATITINSVNDYGATISFGEDIYPDHIVTIDMEQNEIVSIYLNG